MILVVGRSGSGKSMLARELANRLEYKYIDIDKIGHQIYKDAEVLEKFVNFSEIVYLTTRVFLIEKD